MEKRLPTRAYIYTCIDLCVRVYMCMCTHIYLFRAMYNICIHVRGYQFLANIFTSFNHKNMNLFGIFLFFFQTYQEAFLFLPNFIFMLTLKSIHIF